MRKNKVYIRGAYAPGNIGDDVLMICVINIVKKSVEGHEISVGVEHPELAKKFDPQVDWVHIKSPISADIVVFGGGGQFFSFNPPECIDDNTFTNKVKRITNSIKAQKNLISLIERVIISKLGAIDKIFFYNKMAAFCIGLGPFDNKGKGYNRAKDIINKCSYISVRDDKSKELCNELGYKNAKQFTDPSLLPELWFNSNYKPVYSDDGYISIILRDWPHDSAGQNCIKKMVQFADELISRGEKVRLVSLYKDREENLIKTHGNYTWLIWDPNFDSIEEFMRKLIGDSEVIISARAHGVLLPASLGVPSIAVEIENKLRKVHQMIPKGSLLIEEHTSEEFNTKLQDFRLRKIELTNGLAYDLTENVINVKGAVTDFTSWLSVNV